MYKQQVELVIAELLRAKATPPRASSRRWLRWLAALFAFGLGVLLISYVLRAPLLKGLAEAWVLKQPTAHADAIVILGGGLENRPFAAAKLYHDGLAPKILYMNVKLDATARLGILPTEAELTRRLLLSNNIPETAIVAIGDHVASTYDEAMAVRAWVEQNGAMHIVVVTDPFHTRRARWIFQREFKGRQIEIEAQPAPLPDYDLTNWWRHENGLIAFQNEIVKTIYYHIKY